MSDYLINSARNHATHLLNAEDIREGRGEGRSGLNGGEGLLTDVGTFIKTKDRSRRINRNTLLDTNHVVVHLAHVIHIIKNKRLFSQTLRKPSPSWD